MEGPLLQNCFAVIVIVCGCVCLLSCGGYGNVMAVNASTATVEATTRKIYTWHRKGATSPAALLEASTINPRMASYCTTPNGDSGFCLEIQNCSTLLSQLSNASAHEFIRESHCGPKNEDPKRPKVCCGKFDNYITKYPEKPEKTKSPLPKLCGIQNVTLKARIFGGNEARLGEFPWMVRLIHKNSYGYKTFGCSGFLIGSKFVLTAAHCLDSNHIRVIGNVFEVEIGEHNLHTNIDCESLPKNQTRCAEKPQTIRVAENIVHHRYDKISPQHHSDIGLIHLKKGAKFTDFVYPLCLPEAEENSLVEYWISGWGKTETEEISPVKMKLSLPQFPWDDCLDKYRAIDIRIIKSQICAGGKKGKDSCVGDSGGPLMAYKNGTWHAAGIVSYGLGCGKEGWPGVYTNVYNYVDWIKRQMTKKSTGSTKKRSN